jgi:hypothetical protein
LPVSAVAEVDEEGVKLSMPADRARRFATMTGTSGHKSDPQPGG